MKTIEIKQGQSVGITIAFDEVVDGALYLGVYPKDCQCGESDILLKNNDFTPVPGTVNVYQATLTSDITRELNIGSYSVELMIKKGNGMSSISQDPIKLIVSKSNIGTDSKIEEGA